MGILEEIKNINEAIFDCETSLRIRTKRSRQRTAIEAYDKKLIRLYKEDKELRKCKYDLPMIDLIPPIQKGYKRYFVVREDVKNSKIGHFYENLLQKINTVQYNDTKVFKKKVKRFGKKIRIEREQKLKELDPIEFSKLKLNEKQIECFELQTVQKVRRNLIYEHQVYVFKEPWRYVLRVRPNIIDKVKAFDSELEQRLVELQASLYENHKNKGRLSKIRGWHWNHFGDDKKYESPLKNSQIQAFLLKYGE